MRFFQRPYPSANAVLLEGPRPILVDPGDPSGIARLRTWLGPTVPALIANTHWHVDHSGANHLFPGLPIAVPAGEAATIRAWHPDPGRARWMLQPNTRYPADIALAPGDTLETGAETWSVLALPGHTAHQIGFFCAATRTLIAGDALHERDLGWLDVDEDPAALAAAAHTIGTIEALAPSLVLSGHGPPITDLPAALRLARRRLETWSARPDRLAWHASKRIATHALILAEGMTRPQLDRYAATAPWLATVAARAFATTPAEFMPQLLAELLRSGAVAWRLDRLVASVQTARDP